MTNLPSEGFVPYSADEKGTLITHLCYIDDTIFFSSGDLPSINMMNKLNTYEKVSGQLVNKSKSDFILSAIFSINYISDVENVIDFFQLHFPFQYLGCPIYKGKTKIV